METMLVVPVYLLMPGSENVFGLRALMFRRSVPLQSASLLPPIQLLLSMKKHKPVRMNLRLISYPDHYVHDLNTPQPMLLPVTRWSKYLLPSGKKSLALRESECMTASMNWEETLFRLRNLSCG